MAKIFISYSRNDKEKVNDLSEDLVLLGHTVWFDQHLEGGQTWWDEIIAQILGTNYFVFILSQYSINSVACKKEFQYAVDLNKTIIPIQISGKNVPINLLPQELSTLQIVPYNSENKNSILRIAKIFFETVPTTKLPDNLPKPPEIPISYLGGIATEIDSSESLPFEKQSAFFIDIKKSLSDPLLENDAFTLLSRLRSRRDIFATIADEIDTLLISEKSKTETILDKTKKKTITINNNNYNVKKSTSILLGSIFVFLVVLILLTGMFKGSTYFSTKTKVSERNIQVEELLIPMLNQKLRPPSGQNNIYVSYLTFMDPTTGTSLLQTEVGSLLDNAISDALTFSNQTYNYIKHNEPGHIIKNTDNNMNTLVNITFDPNLTKGEKISKIINILMKPNNVDIILTGQYIDKGNTIDVRPLVIVASEQKVVTKVAQIKKDQFICNDQYVKTLCQDAHEEIAKLVKELLEAL